jgi:hypothetical protein
MRKKATILMLYASSPTNVGLSGSSAIMASSQRRNVTLKEVTTVASGNGSTTVTLKGMQRMNEWSPIDVHQCKLKVMALLSGPWFTTSLHVDDGTKVPKVVLGFKIGQGAVAFRNLCVGRD